MKLLIFDFDGVIADSFDVVLNIASEIASRRGYRTLELGELEVLKKMESGEIVKKLGIPWYRLMPILNEIRRAYVDRLKQIPIFDGMGEVLAGLKEADIEMGIVTSNSQKTVDDYLKLHGIDQFFDFVIPIRGLVGKHRVLKKILRERKIKGADVLYVGDEIRDIKSAKKAGVKSAAVTWGYNSEQALRKNEPDFVFLKPSELLNLRS